MDNRISMIFLWIICQCFYLHLCCNLHELKYDLEAKNLSLTIMYRQVLLTWDCDVPKENFSGISYSIYWKTDQGLTFEKEAKVCGKAIELFLADQPLDQVCVRVVPTLKDEECPNASEICGHPGRNEKIENITCNVYNVSSMKCIWTFPPNIPYITEYTLSLKQEATTINCQDYGNVMEKRTARCSFHDLTIHYFKEVTIIMNTKGSDDHVLKDEFIPAKKEILNPPTNITVEYFEENGKVSWDVPRTQYKTAESCFQYQMEKNKEFIFNVSNPYFMSNFENKFLIRIRATGLETCGMTTNWGLWSEEISYDVPQKQDNSEFITLLIILGISCFIVLLIITIAIQYKRILTLFFPRIPQPKNYFDGVQDSKIMNTKIDVISPVL